MALKTVLITGCSTGGIGSGLAEVFQKRNLRVFATARDASKMTHLEKLSNVTLITLDPTSRPSVNAAVEIVKAQTGGTLNYPVENAGQMSIMPTLDFDIETAKSMYDINIWRMMRVTQEFAPLVTAVDVCSISTSVNTPWMGVYAGSRAAMTVITDIILLELAPFSVKAVIIHTEAVNTNIFFTGINCGRRQRPNIRASKQR